MFQKKLYLCGENLKEFADMKQTDIARLGSEDTFSIIGKEWMLVTAGTPDHFNTMTASWGGLGWLWNRPVAFIFVRPERYTHQFIEETDRLTLSFLGDGHRKALSLCGTLSGRDCDKVAQAGLTPVSVADGCVTFSQARLTVVGRKLYRTEMRPEEFLDGEALARWYGPQAGGFHTVYVIGIEEVFEA